ncbi:hypothetical protein FNH13_18670 [Ornithinimicrobium ciconiae]|uniref:Uncharacterized protein n=1 Tax=Ornithinimicrobium ciconiae TaxID=2594265 RepID=A0A516GEZ6_9MICO|nr:hypothetical protein [Ornithinimicrobium ciconiae]QDO90099.1 hypothetical protein FNH13_18670 [Ornithinimicrobium ciconiae]
MTISRRQAAAPLLALMLALGMGACGSDTDTGGDAPTTSEDAAPTSDAAPSTGDETEPTAAPTTEEPSVTPQPTDPADPSGGTALPTGPVSDEVIASEPVQAAISDLAERESVAADAVTVAGHQAVTWSDGSLGCPKPGMMYTQALVPGHLLVLEVDGAQFSYHSGDRGNRAGEFTYCADPHLPNNLGTGSATM